MAYVKGQPFKPQFIDPATNTLMSNGTVEFYLTGTSTPTPYYTDSSGTAGGTSLTLDSGGKPSTDVFFDESVTYKLVVKNAAGGIVETLEPYQVNQGITNTADLTHENDGTVYVLADYLANRHVVNTKDFGAVGDGSTNDSAALSAALNYGAGRVYGNPGDVYLLESGVASAADDVIFDLRGATVLQGSTWSGDAELIKFTGARSGCVNGAVEGNQVATDVTNGIQGDYSGLVVRSESIFAGLSFKNMGDSGLKINFGKGDTVKNILCTNNHIATGQSSSGNVRFDSCEELESENIIITESYGKGVAWAACSRCTHNGLIVDRETEDTASTSTGVYTTSSNDVFISNVYTRNVRNKLSQFSNNINISNFKLINNYDTTFRIQGGSRCQLSNGEIIGASDNRTCIIGQHPDVGLGVSNPANNQFNNVRFESSIESVLALDGNSSDNRFHFCLFNETASDTTGATTDYVVIDSGTGNVFDSCDVYAVDASDFGGVTHAGAGWLHRNCKVSVPFSPVQNFAAGTIEGGEYIATDGSNDGIVANAALEMRGSKSLVDGSTAAVAALRLNAAGNRIIHSEIKTITDSVDGYGVRFGGADVEDTQIMYCHTSGGDRSIKSVTQSTTNKLSFITLEGGGVDNGVNGTNNPGAHHSEYMGTAT